MHGDGRKDSFTLARAGVVPSVRTNLPNKYAAKLLDSLRDFPGSHSNSLIPLRADVKGLKRLLFRCWKNVSLYPR